jgi:Acetyltransferase (GNAT) family
MNIAQRNVRRQSIDTSHIDIRMMEHDDVPDVVRLFDQYFHETQWTRYLMFDPAKTKERLHQHIDGKRTPHLLARDNGHLVGLISWHYDTQYTDEIAVMDEVYCLKPYRRTDLGRKLVALALYLAKGDDAKVFNFPVASGLPETATLINMLKHKFGGEICGVLVRCMPQGGDDGR